MKDSGDITDLISDRELDTSELHPPNDFYGHARVLKQFVGVPEDQPTYCVIEHGPFFPTLHWDVDVHAPFPVFLSANSESCKALANQTDKMVYAIGPLIAYANCSIDSISLTLEKKRLGKNLVIFPPHSTHHVESRFDVEWLIQHARNIGKSYDTITVCLYWKDAAMAPIFRDHGFDCTTAGHMYDPLFLNRLKTILTLADAVISYSWCSIIGYAVMMDLPTMVVPVKGQKWIASEAILTRDTVGGLYCQENNAYKHRIVELFSELGDLTTEKREAIDYMWGLSQVKTRDELSLILQLAKDMYAAHKAYDLGAFPNPLSQGRFYRQVAAPQRAAAVLEQALAMGLQSPDLYVEAALAQAELGNATQSRCLSNRFRDAYPQQVDQKIQVLFNGIQVDTVPAKLPDLAMSPEYESNADKTDFFKNGKIKRKLLAEGLDWIGVRFLDPIGRTFRMGGSYYKAIYPQAAANVRQLFAKGIVDELVKNDLLVGFSECDLQVPGYAFVVKSHTTPFHTEPKNWPTGMLKDAALKYLEINRYLLRHDLGLLDGHSGNFVQGELANPLWCDLGSIVELQGRSSLGLDEFLMCFVYPLLLMAKNSELGRIARLMMQNGGVGNDAYRALTNESIVLKDSREHLLNGLSDLVQKLVFPSTKTTWSEYQEASTLDALFAKKNNCELDDLEQLNPHQHSVRNHFIEQLMTILAPRTMIDIGSNAGYFSCMAAKKGTFVYSADTDELAIEKFYQFIKDRKPNVKLNIEIDDVLTYKHCNTAELVIALALTHHLAISGQFKFDYIARILAARSRYALITEFMPYGLGGTRPLPSSLPGWYHIEGFVEALKAYFAEVEVIDYPMPADHAKRILIFAKERTAASA